MTPLDAAWQDFAQAQAEYKADPSESNRLAYLAATNATHALVAKQAMELTPRPVAVISKHRACYFCGKVLDARAGFIETVSQPDGTRRDFCSAECLHWQLHEDEKAE